MNLKKIALLMGPTALGLAALMWWSRSREDEAEEVAAKPQETGKVDYEALASDPAERKKMMSAVGRVAGRSKKAKKAPAAPEAAPPA